MTAGHTEHTVSSIKPHTNGQTCAEKKFGPDLVVKVLTLRFLHLFLLNKESLPCVCACVCVSCNSDKASVNLKKFCDLN